jgi:hypothetical protein
MYDRPDRYPRRCADACGKRAAGRIRSAAHRVGAQAWRVARWHRSASGIRQDLRQLACAAGNGRSRRSKSMRSATASRRARSPRPMRVHGRAVPRRNAYGPAAGRDRATGTRNRWYAVRRRPRTRMCRGWVGGRRRARVRAHPGRAADDVPMAADLRRPCTCRSAGHACCWHRPAAREDRCAPERSPRRPRPGRRPRSQRRRRALARVSRRACGDDVPAAVPAARARGSRSWRPAAKAATSDAP